MKSALDNGTTMSFSSDNLVERNLKFVAFVPFDDLNRGGDPNRDLFVRPAVRLAVKYINDGLKICQGDRTHPLRVNVSVDYYRSGVS